MMLKLRVGLLIFASFYASVATSDEPRRTVDLVGNQIFSDDDLKDALRGEPDYLLAIHPLAPASELGSVIERLLKSGYRNRGFRDVDVSAAPADPASKVICRISEGPQFKRGDVLIDGCQLIEAERLVERLTQPFPKEGLTPTFREIQGKTQTLWINEKGNREELSDPVWERDEPATFGTERFLKNKVQDALKDVGFSKAFFIVRIQSDQNTNTADMVVSIIDEGTPNLANEVVIEGLKSHSRGQLIDFLDLQPAQIINRTALTEMRRKLWESGRFQSIDVSFDEKTKALTLDLSEVDGVPTVDEPIDEHATVLMKTRDWLASCDEMGLDMEVSYGVGEQDRMTFIQSSAGVLLEVNNRKRQANEEAPGESTLTILADNESILIDQSDHPSLFRFESAAVDGKLHFSSTMRAADDENRAITQIFNFHAATKRADGEPAIAHHWVVSRADFLSIIYQHGVKKRLTDDEMILEHNELKMTLDRQSGAIKHWNLKDGDVRFGPGLFRLAKKRVAARHVNKPNAFDRERSFSTLVAYFISKPMLDQLQRAGDVSENPISMPDPVALSAARKLIDADVFAIPDALVSYFTHQTDKEDDEKFIIPGDRPKATDFKSMFVELGAKLVLKIAPKTLPEDGWPLKVAREVCLIAMGRGKYSGRVLNELIEDPDSGPLCHATVAYLLGLLGQDHHKTFAARGLSVMTAEHFASDYELLTSLTHHDLVMKTIRSIQSLNDEELEAVLEAINNESFKKVLRLAAIHPLDAKRSQSDFWFQISRAKLEPWLQKMAR